MKSTGARATIDRGHCCKRQILGRASISSWPSASSCTKRRRILSFNRPPPIRAVLSADYWSTRNCRRSPIETHDRSAKRARLKLTHAQHHRPSERAFVSDSDRQRLARSSARFHRAADTNVCFCCHQYGRGPSVCAACSTARSQASRPGHRIARRRAAQAMASRIAGTECSGRSASRSSRSDHRAWVVESLETLQASPHRFTCEASAMFRCRRLCWRRSTRRSAVKPESITLAAKT